MAVPHCWMRDAADRACHQQDDLHRIAELAQEGAPARLFLCLREGVRPELLQPRFGFRGTEALGGIDLFMLQRIADTEGMPDWPCCGRAWLRGRRTHLSSPLAVLPAA